MSELRLIVLPADSDEEADWQAQAFCRQLDPDLWHAETPQGTATAKRLCVQHCDVIEQCLTSALVERQEWGVWGGASPAMRTRALNKAETPEEAADVILTCSKGHRFTRENTHFRASGERRCRICDKKTTQRSQKRAA